MCFSFFFSKVLNPRSFQGDFPSTKFTLLMSHLSDTLISGLGAYIYIYIYIYISDREHGAINITTACLIVYIYTMR